MNCFGRWLNRGGGYIISALFFIVLAVIIFRVAWGGGHVFSASDANIAIVSRAHNQLPESFFGSYSTTPVFGNVRHSALSIQKMARWLLSPEVCTDSLYAIYLILSSLFLTAFLRLWSLRWLSCVLGSLSAFWVGSITLASSGHDAKFGVIMLFCLALLCVEKAIRSTRVWSRTGLATGAGVAVGLMLLEQQDVGLLSGIFLGPYVIFRLVQRHLNKPLIWLQVLLPIALIGAGLSIKTALKAYSANVTQAGLSDDPQHKWDFVTQWSMVPEELPDLIAPGYTGWSSGNPDGPYWGKAGQSAEWAKTRAGFRNFRLDSVYIGFIPIFMAIAGVVLAFLKRKEDKEEAHAFLCWAGLGTIALFLAFGKYSPLYKWFFHLPLVGNIRAPLKFLQNFQVIVGILCAFGINELLSRGNGESRTIFKRLLIVCGVFAGLFFMLAISASNDSFSEWGKYADVIVRNIRLAWVHAGVMSLFLAGLFFCFSRKLPVVLERSLPLILLVALVFDSSYLTGKYFKADDVAVLKRGNPVINYLKEHQGDERVYMTNKNGPYARWLPLDGAYHQINFFNIWQMARMPSEYKVFLGAAQNDAPRLWQLASCRYITASASLVNDVNAMKLFSPLMFYRFVQKGGQIDAVQLENPATKNDQVLLEFKNYLPRFALFTHWEIIPHDRQCGMLFSKSFDPLKGVVLDEGIEIAEPAEKSRYQEVVAETTLQDATVKTDSEQPGVLLFTQRYLPQWTVTVDGKLAEILRVNYLCMGVFVPAGSHEIVFSCKL